MSFKFMLALHGNYYNPISGNSTRIKKKNRTKAVQDFILSSIIIILLPTGIYDSDDP